MTITQQAYLNIERRITELKHIEKHAHEFDYWIVKNTRRCLEEKLMEISRYLTCERHSKNY